MSEHPETPEGEHQTDETAIIEEATVSEPPALVPAPPRPPPVIPPFPPYEGDRPEVAAARPEIPIGAAFAGGFALALILKRLAR